jgi:hypothetical protein
MGTQYLIVKRVIILKGGEDAGAANGSAAEQNDMDEAESPLELVLFDFPLS